LLAVAVDQWIAFYDPQTLEPKREVLPLEYDTWVYDLAFSPDGGILAGGTLRMAVPLWSVGNNQLLRVTDTGAYMGGSSMGSVSVAFSPDGQWLISTAGSPILWNVASGELQQFLQGHNGDPNCVDFAPDGTLATASDDHTVRLWSIPDGSLLRTLEHTGPVHRVAFAPDGSTLASGAGFLSDNTVRLWNAGDGTLLHTLEGHAEFVLALAFSPSGQILASASSDETVRLWRVGDGTLLRTLEFTGTVRRDKYLYEVRSLAFSPDGCSLAMAVDDPQQPLQIWGVIGER
jgi:WD40 repeat protein